MAAPRPLTGTRPSPDSDVALVEAARAGASWAREMLFHRHASLVSGLAYRLLGRDEGIEDIVQDTFVEALASLGRLRDPAYFGTWLGAITIRTTGKVLRQRQLLRRLGLRAGRPAGIDALVSPAAPPDVAAELRAIYRVVDDLPTSLRIPFILRRVHGATLDEIAEMMGISLSTAKRRLWEAERRFDERLRARKERD
jgi:RNA polymerase sigma-70 factor (ECF subfamily)